MSRLYPIFLDIANKPVVVIGGGHIARRKVAALLARKADVLVISPDVVDEISRLASEGSVRLLEREYQAGDLEGAWLTIASSDNMQVNEAVFKEAHDRQIFCNVVDIPELCSFHVPAVAGKGDLQIAVSTDGSSPAMAKHIRKQLEVEYGDNYEDLLDALKALRVHLKQKYPTDQGKRAEILSGFIQTNALDLLKESRMAEFGQLLDRWKEK